MVSLYKQKIKPMLANLGTEKDLARKGFIFEPKFDGVRCILYKIGKKVRLLNRQGDWFEKKFPEITKEARNIQHNFILDGEIVVLDKHGLPNFNKIEFRYLKPGKNKVRKLSKEMPATYYVFDILILDKKNLTKLPLSKRKSVISKNISGRSVVVKTLFTDDSKKLWRIIKRVNMSGVVAKSLSSPYEIGKRSKFWIKIKNINSK